MKELVNNIYYNTTKDVESIKHTMCILVLLLFIV